MARGVDAVHRAGGICVKHTDGDIAEIIDLIVDSGIDAIGPLEPAAGMDLLAVQDRYGDRVAVVGNIDVDLLCRGTPSGIRDETNRLVVSLAKRGGHVLSSGNTITSAVKPNNFRAMIEGARSIGLK